MKLPKFVLVILLCTGISLFYVWQQTEIVRLAYAGQKTMAQFQELLDENSLLRYNLSIKTSLTTMGNALTAGNDFHMPKNYCLVKVETPESSRLAQRRSSEKINVVSRIIGVKRQAQAKTINPLITFPNKKSR
jgi:hypothetical protein